jgi:hypothetical protein
MKFSCVVIATGLSAFGWIPAATPQSAGDAAAVAPATSLDALIRNLADPSFKTREEATRQIWRVGEGALAALEAAAAVDDDPEMTYRAGELIRKIELSITPETDSVIVALIERYAKASPNERLNLLNQLTKKRAWRQILKLYATEKEPELQARLQSSAKEVAVHAARECLMVDDLASAKEFLEMAPADATGLMALAEFHRSQGTLAEELKRAGALAGRNSDAWQLALHRAAGDLEAARDFATAAGESRISTAMSVLLGDPLPWLRADLAASRENPIRKAYTSISINKWQGRAVRPSELDPLLKAVGNRNSTERQHAINCLFLLGEARLAELAIAKNSPFSAFKHFEALERIPDALKALNLDPETPDFTTWVGKRIDHLFNEDADEDGDISEETEQLVGMANFLERRGLDDASADAYFKPLARLANEDSAIFTDFLARLFGNEESLSGAPQLAKRLGIEWAGEDPGRWTELVHAALGEEDEPLVWWDWLAELDPKASRQERFDAMLALFDIGADPSRLRAKWLALAWDAVDQAPEEKQPALIVRLSYVSTRLSSRGGNVEQCLKAWDRLPETKRNDIFWGGHILNLSAADRWDEAAGIFIKQVERLAELKQEPRPDLYAYAAACLRQSGQQEEAANYDSLADKLALGSVEYSIQIGHAYAYGRDYKRALEWWSRATRTSDPESVEFATALQLIESLLLDEGDWKSAAAISEVLAQTYSSPDYVSLPAISLLRQRLQADMARALNRLKSDRDTSIATLEKCHQLFPSDGSLADHFFPALRKVGLTGELDKWFNISWDLIAKVVERYPASDNSFNTAGWLAARARLKLDLAQDYLDKALSMNPEQPAYLDTMAEIQFAKGNRKKALEWSQGAVNFAPQDSLIRRQHERFRSAPLPQ